MQKNKTVVFHWIPKVAGTSIYGVLEKEFHCRKLKELMFARTYNKKEFCVTFGHMSVERLRQIGVLEREKKDFEFCIVRNPYDRLVSLYTYLKYDTDQSFEDFVKELNNRFSIRNRFLVFTKIFMFFANKSVRFRNLAEKIFRSGFGKKIRRYIPLPEVGLYNVFDLSQANQQVDWITNSNGELVVDKVCRYENLEEGFEDLCKILGIRAQLPKKNTTKHKHYREYYDEHTKKLVAEMYKDDIAMFGYTF